MLGMAGLAIATDITDLESVRRLAEEVAETYESVDVLINNAGICLNGPFADITMQDWCGSRVVYIRLVCCGPGRLVLLTKSHLLLRHMQMNVNCLGAVAVTLAFLPKIEASKYVAFIPATVRGRCSLALPLILKNADCRGSIVCVNSFGGVMPLTRMTAYTSSKYALAGEQSKCVSESPTAKRLMRC